MKIVKIDKNFWLKDNNIFWMSNKSSEMIEIEHVNTLIRGNVLVAGLGLGLCVDRFIENPNVKHITVVERDESVIELVTYSHPRIPVEIIHNDIYEYFKTATEKYDFIYGDIVNHWTGDNNIDEYLKFMEMGKQLLKDNGEIYHWENNKFKKSAVRK